jgi:HAD superfamily hydrolase (TIGR01484 family)
MKTHSPKKSAGSYSGKKLIVFDLDGTLTDSKTPIKADMIATIGKLLAKKRMAVIGGGSWKQFQWQFVKYLKYRRELLENLYLFPTTSMSFYRHQRGGWKNIYKKTISAAELKAIKKAFDTAYKKLGYEHPPKVYGEVLENRESQVTFSPLGQDVVTVLGKKGLRMKEEWRKKNEKMKVKIANMVQKQLPNLEVRRGGITSIDVTKKGIDKAYGVRKIEKTLHVPIKDMLFVGDALYKGGNDAAAKKTGVRTVQTSGPKETKKIIESVLRN